MHRLMRFLGITAALLAATASLATPAAPGSAVTAPAPAPKPVVVRQPPPPPPANAATEAYQFRTRILATPECQRFATEADAVFYDGGKDIGSQAAELKKIKTRAKTEKCLAAK
jgi:hypothetical protein